MPKKTKHEISIRSVAAEYLTFVSTIGDQPGSVELRYEDEADSTNDGRALRSEHTRYKPAHKADLQ